MNDEEQAAADEGMAKLSDGHEDPGERESSSDGGLFAAAELCWGGILFRWSAARS